jgi:hypothetical protein
MGFSFVPGLCNYTPFMINQWMIPRFPESNEEKLLRNVPELKDPNFMKGNEEKNTCEKKDL